jgi:hypothetical protein
MNNKLKPALIAGGALGVVLVITVVLSVVPILGLARCCNCLWPIVAGALATMLCVKSSPTPVSIGDGAIVGAITGAIGGLIYLVIGMPIYFVLGGVAAMSMQIRQISPNFPLTGVVLLLIGGVIGFVIYLVLATIGGLIGVPIFEKRKNGTAPPPPQNFA